MWAIGSLAVWLGLLHVVGRYTWGYGRLTFWMLLAVCSVLSVAWRGRRLRLDLSAQRPLRVVLSLILLTQVALLVDGLTHELTRPNGETLASDIAENTYRAGTHLLDGQNPYEQHSQVLHRIQPSRHVTVREGAVEMYGVPYDYGYPYFPAMLISYLPGRPLAEGFDSIRVVNAILLVVNTLGIMWLAFRHSPPQVAVDVALLGAVAYLGVAVLVEELFRLAVTDLVIATYALSAFLALSHRRFRLAGVLLGAAQACKLLPGPLLVLPVLVWLWKREGAREVLGGYLAAILVLLVPFVLLSPPHFLSSTVLFYLTNHAPGDTTSLWYFLPDGARGPFQALGYLLALAVAALPARHRGADLAVPMAVAFASYVVFVAFSNMTHLNYLWAVYPLGCCALAVFLGRAVTTGTGDTGDTGAVAIMPNPSNLPSQDAEGAQAGRIR